jgi:hypothetical protein
MHCDFPCSREKLESVKFHKVVPQDPLQQRPSLADETPMTTFPICDDYLINKFEHDLI